MKRAVDSLFLPPHFTAPTPPAFDAWDAKALAEEIAAVVAPHTKVSLEAGEAPVLWRVMSAGTHVGDVRPVTLDAPPWAAPAFGVEISLGVLEVAPVAPPGENAHAPPAPAARVSVRYRALPTMPPAEFDLAFIVPDSLAAGRVEDALRTSAGELLEAIVLFDEFRGKGVPEGQRSLAWRLTFRHPERTLNEKELAGRRQKIIATAERELGVVARTG